MRTVEEWIGKTDDTPAPPRVRLRCFEREGGICFLSGVKIRAGMRWELHHKVALIRGGQNRESNLVPVLYKPHKEQTALDVAEKAVIYRKRSKHLGITKTKKKIPSRGFGWAPSNTVDIRDERGR